MQIPSWLRETLWNPTTLGALPAFVFSLLLAALLGALLGEAYVRFGRSLSNRRMFARNFLLLTVATTLVISIIKSSLALSLGLVGALSIVRFRAAIKEPEELAFLFLAIAAGLGLGAGQALATIVALVIIVGLIALRSLVLRRPDQPNLYVTIASEGPTRLTPNQILAAIVTCNGSGVLKRLDATADRTEAAFLVEFKDVARLESLGERLRELNPTVTLSCIDDRGIGA
jgi:hypothetical protein